MSQTHLRLHPAIGIARVGNSEEYYLGPESLAGMPIPGSPLRGGLPIKPDTENTPIDSADLRDDQGRLKRQAARFRIYQYSNSPTPEQYPNGGGAEVVIGSVVEGKTVVDIVWTVHVANKKANSWNTEGVQGFEDGKMPPLRNSGFMGSSEVANLDRLKHLVIDAGPRAIRVSESTSVQCDKHTPASYWDEQTEKIVDLPNYPKSFPASEPDSAPPAYSQAITTLGALRTEPKGRLLVLGGHGLACGFDDQGQLSPYAPLKNDVNNDRWLDDTADGPVSAVLIFDDGTARTVDSNAWVIATDPAYAPQTTNVVTLWDDLYSTWLEHLQLQPSVYKDGVYEPGFKPYFPRDIQPILKAASLQKWNVSLPTKAMTVHDRLGAMQADGLDFMIMNFIRDPQDDRASSIGTPLMPLSLGDVNKSFLTVTPTQYFFLRQWANGEYARVQPPTLGPGEELDKTILFNCLGGRFSPGIEMTFIVRDVNLYRQDWHKPEVGPFRINQQALDYRSAKPDQPFLGVGYIPLRNHPVQPGDISKFMAIPWHTDYNSCATHLPSPNPGGELTPENIDEATGLQGSINTLLYASWPAQRPVAVYTYDDVQANGGVLPRPRFSVRGAGTASPDASHVGRYQNRVDFLLNWSRVGVVLQGPAIVGYPTAGTNDPQKYGQDFFLEVASQFEHDESNLAEYWRNTVIDRLYPPLPKQKP